MHNLKHRAILGALCRQMGSRVNLSTRLMMVMAVIIYMAPFSFGSQSHSHLHHLTCILPSTHFERQPPLLRLFTLSFHFSLLPHLFLSLSLSLTLLSSVETGEERRFQVISVLLAFPTASVLWSARHQSDGAALSSTVTRLPV